MTKPAISAQCLGKRYTKGLSRADQLVGRGLKSLMRSFRKDGDDVRNDSDVIWALRNATFEIQPGEVVGIIGPNGAGKSTMLKVLSRITDPTEGEAWINGRVGSLLEVGTGMNPELTGRENVFVNGCVLGMSRGDVRRKYEEIVEFAGIGPFMDTPVKRYSTGMKLRLAFSVAAHLDPEIIMIDEVLAVGDAAFQKKCLGAMEEVSRKGRTVLFVSHNMPAVAGLCSRALWIDGGRIVADGASGEVVAEYLKDGCPSLAQKIWADADSAPGDGTMKLRAAQVHDAAGKVKETFDVNEELKVTLKFELLRGPAVILVQLRFLTEGGVTAFSTFDRDPRWADANRPTGHYVSTVTIPGNLLAEGRMIVRCLMHTRNPNQKHIDVENLLAFDVQDRADGTTARGTFGGRIYGIVRPRLDWVTERVSK